VWDELEKRARVPSSFNCILGRRKVMVTTSETKAVGNTLLTLRSDGRPVKGL
jgi:hypothetical protein